MDFFKDKKVLVTGATGFVGSHLTKKLIASGAHTRILAREGRKTEIVASHKALGCEVFYGDVRSKEEVSKAAEGCEIIFHIAALFREAKHDDSVYYEINVEGTRNVLDAAEEHGVDRVVHCSTVGVHSHIPNPPADETEAYRPGDIYQETKCEGEKLALERFKSGRVKGAVVRPAMIWGEGDLRMLKLFKGVSKRRFPIIGDGKTLTHWVYVHDLVNGFMLAAQKEEALGQVYIIAGEGPVSIENLVTTVAKVAGVEPLPVKVPALPVQLLGSLVEIICKPIGVEPPIYRRRVDFFTKDRCFNTSKAKKQLGYKAEQSFETEVQNIYSWYKQEGFLG